MTLVLVHGNPETPAIWDPMCASLAERDNGIESEGIESEGIESEGIESEGIESDGIEVVALSPPGFGAPVPDGFGATMAEYRDWLVAELEALSARPDGGPVDLLGHDWGGGHVMRIAMERPDLIRSWCTDVIGLFDRDYEWHDAAQVWQSPDGEASIERMISRPNDQRIPFYAGMGMGTEVATALVPHINAHMGASILALYRDAAQPAMARLGEGLEAAAARPGLCILATGDHFTGGDGRHRRCAERAGAQVVELADVGHWWMCENPKLAAQTVASWVASLDAGGTASA